MSNKFELFRRKMEIENLPRIVIDTFEYYYNQLIKGETGFLQENEIETIDDLQLSNNLDEEFKEYGKSILSNTVIIKLNGGLGTSMGLSEAKSLLKVKNGLTFLDIIAKQSELNRVPLLLMNSFNTQKKSLELLKKYSHLTDKLPVDFLQHKIPKINSNTFLPAEYTKNKELEWCPPGHGDIYTALVTSGVLDQLLKKNIEFAFISNADNLGAVIDYKILGFFAKNNFPFLMEVANRTEADKKGGHLARTKNGKLVLRELAQCRKEDENDFQNVAKHKYFNTNSIWVNLKALKSIMADNNNILGLPMIVNKKTVDPRNADSENVFQLETAMGAAISVFDNAAAIQVPRSRFAPVKTTDDLLSVRSDNYILTEDFRIIENPERKLKPLVISLDKNYYKLVDDLDSRIPHAPSLVNCESLTIRGDYKFGENVICKGEVILENTMNKQARIKSKTLL